MITLGEKVKTIREEKGMSIETLSQITRISSTQLRSIEAGRSSDFIGDEQYLKMYLRRIATALNVDEHYFNDDFLAWTQEVSALEIEAAIATSNTQAIKKDKTIAYHVNDSIQQAKRKQAYSKNKKHVYEDRYLMRYLKYLIIGCLVFALFFMVWKVISMTSQLDTEYVAPDIGNVESNEELEDVIPDESEEEMEEDEIISDDVEFTTEDGMTFYVGGIMEGEVINIEVTFNEDGAFKLWNDGTAVDGSYSTDYVVGDKYVFEGTCSVGSRFTFNFWNLESSVIKVNGNVIEYDIDQLLEKDGVHYLMLTFTGE